MIPIIPQTIPTVQGPAAPVEPDLSGYPKRSTCAHCTDVITLASSGERWTVRGRISDSRECHLAPNPDEGPMPGHVPGTAILHPPKR